jgi:hypothetical protein
MHNWFPQKDKCFGSLSTCFREQNSLPTIEREPEQAKKKEKPSYRPTDSSDFSLPATG